MTDETTTTPAPCCKTCACYRLATCRRDPPKLRYRGAYSSSTYGGGSSHGSMDSVTQWPAVREGDWCYRHRTITVDEEEPW